MALIENPHAGATVDTSDIRAALDYLAWLEANGSVVHGGTGNDMRGAVISIGDISGGDIRRNRR